MGKPQSDVTISNMALGLINAGTVTNIDSPTTKLEGTLSRWIDQSRREALRKHAWNFAIQRAKIAKSTTPPLFNYNAQYPLPNDFIRLLTVGRFEDVKGYQVENNHILIGVESDASTEDATALPIRYIFDFKTIALMDPLFIKVWILELAANIAMEITGKIQFRRDMIRTLDATVGEAYSIDGQERPPTKIERSKYLGARRGLRGITNPTVASPFVIFDD